MKYLVKLYLSLISFFRTLTFLYLPIHNFWLLLCPSALSYDWQMGSIPLIHSLYDPRACVAIPVFYGTLLLAFMSICYKRLSGNGNKNMMEVSMKELVKCSDGSNIILLNELEQTWTSLFEHGTNLNIIILWLNMNNFKHVHLLLIVDRTRIRYFWLRIVGFDPSLMWYAPCTNPCSFPNTQHDQVRLCSNEMQLIQWNSSWTLKQNFSMKTW